MIVSERYTRNLGSFSETELANIRKKSVCVVGCGGLGGFVADSLARFGVGRLTLIDGDVFCSSNLNRQLFSTKKNLGQNKALATADALHIINSEVAVTAHPLMLNAENAPSLLAGHDVIIDCLDSIAARRMLGFACENLKVLLVHGAISGLYGQVACIYPGNGLMNVIYPVSSTQEPDNVLGNPIFAPQLIAAMQSCEAVMHLAGRESTLYNRILYVNMVDHDYRIVQLMNADLS